MSLAQHSSSDVFAIPSKYLKLIEDQIDVLFVEFTNLKKLEEQKTKETEIDAAQTAGRIQKLKLPLDFSIKLKNVTSEVIRLFNLSVIQGEYYSDICELQISTFRNYLVSFEESFQTTLLSFLNKEDNEYKLCKQEFDTVKEHFHYFDYLSSKISSRIDQSLNQIIDIDLVEKIFAFRNSTNTESKYKNLKFLINVRIAELDEGYVCNPDTRKELSKLISLIEELVRSGSISQDVITKILITKCNFLFLKLEKRLKNNRALEIPDGLNHYTFDIDSIEKFILESGIPVFSNFISDINNHYHNNDIYQLEHIDKSKFLVKTIHKNCKSIKKIIDAGEIGLPQIDELLKNIKNDLNWVKSFIRANPKFKNRSNWFAYVSAESLLNKTYFKLKCYKYIAENVEISQIISNIESIQNIYKSISSEELIKDCFQIDLLYSMFLRDVLKISISKINDETNFPDLVSFIDKIILEFLDSSEKLELHLSKNNELALMPLYLSMEECYGTYSIKESDEEQQIDVFIDSSYILPSDYTNLNKLKNSLTTEFSRLTTTIHIKIATQRESSFESKLKENQFQIIQVIGLYAAIITFILTSLSSASKFQFSKIELLMFMIVFVFCISIFVLLLRAIFSGIMRVITLIMIAAALLVLSVTSIYFLNVNKQVLESKQTELDTLRINKQKDLVIDSIEKIKEKRNKSK